MPKSREPDRLLADVIRIHYGTRGDRRRGHDASPPRLRLQDWQVVEELSVDRAEYVLLRRVGSARNGMDSLTVRERDAVRHASTGASNKDIAREMGISDSTVGVLLLRACRKLEAVDRDDLIRTFQSWLSG
jgi:DNA-binding CsgD family transcriptional regulator